MRDSATTAAAAYGAGGGKDGVLGAEGDCAGGGDQLAMAAADSLIMGQDGCGDFSYSEQVKVNKNNYTLTFSRSDGSMIASTTSGCGTTDILADIRPTGTIIRRKDRGTYWCVHIFLMSHCHWLLKPITKAVKTRG